MREQKPTSTAPRRRTDWLIAGAIFVVALIARMLFLITSPDRDWPHSIFYEGDAVVWVEWATAIDRHEAFNFNLPIHPPGVAYPMAYLYRGVHARDFASMKALWCVMSAAACGLTYFACARNGLGRRVGVVASFLLCFSFGQYVLATSLNSETPYVFLLTAMVVLTQRALRRPALWSITCLGVLQGLALLLRPEHPLLLLMWMAWMLLAKPVGGATHDATTIANTRLLRRARVASVAFMLLVAVLMCTPWTTHAILSVRHFNSVELDPIKFNLAPIAWSEDGRAALNALPAFARHDNFEFICDWAQRLRLPQVTARDVDRFFREVFGYTPRKSSPLVLISNQGPFSFALANHPRSDGGFSRIALAHPMRGIDPTMAFAFPPHNQIFNDGWRVGFGYILDDPRAWLVLVGKKLQRFADGITFGFGSNNLPLGREGVRHRVDILVATGPLAQIWQVALLALLAAGIVLALARRMPPPTSLWALIIINKIIITILFYGYARQAASIAPAFFVFIAITIDSLLLPVDRRWPQWKHWQRAIVLGLCGSMLILDLLLSPSGEKDLILIGPLEQRPDLGPGAFASFGEVEIRRGPM